MHDTSQVPGKCLWLTGTQQSAGAVQEVASSLHGPVQVPLFSMDLVLLVVENHL